MTNINITIRGLPLGRTSDAGWDESKHKRNHGQFASGGGGGGERGSASSRGGRLADQLEAKRKAMAAEHQKEGPTAWKHGNTAKEHRTEAAKHEAHAKKGGPAAQMHAAAAVAHHKASHAHEQARAALNKGDLVAHQRLKKMATMATNEAGNHADKIYNKHGPY